MKAKAIKHKDVQGNELQYIALLGNNGTFKLLKSGPSTLTWMEEQGEQVYETVSAAAMSEQPVLPLEPKPESNENNSDEALRGRGNRGSTK